MSRGKTSDCFITDEVDMVMTTITKNDDDDDNGDIEQSCHIKRYSTCLLKRRLEWYCIL